MATATTNTAPAHMINETTGHPSPVIGSDGWSSGTSATIIAFTGKAAASSGSYAYGVGLFVRADAYDPYVVWSVIATPEGRWVCEAGTYVQTLAAAIEAYERRGGKV